MLGLISISSDGKQSTRFDVSRINDISNPRILTFFVNDTDLYALELGTTNERSTAVSVLKPNGEVEKRSGQTAERKWFIGRFKLDGSYTGSIHLDLPFRPLQFGVFATGDFLVAGQNDE
jgi:hypothetical protein